MNLEETDPNFQTVTNARIAEEVVYFDAYGQSGSVGSVIHYDGTQVNIGGAMNVDSGVFMAPVDGINVFHFHTRMYRTMLGLYFQKIGVMKSEIYSDDHTTGGSFWDHDQMPGQSFMLQLKKGDIVDVYLRVGTLRGQRHFLGYLLYRM